MNVLDIILAAGLAWAVWKGFRQGLIMQAAGLAGIFGGVYFASRLGQSVGSFFGIGEDYASVAGFIIVLVVVIIALIIAGHMAKGLFKLTGLSVLDKLGGVALSVLKMSLILGIFLYGFSYINRLGNFVDQKRLDNSHLYSPLLTVAEFAFPYAEIVKDQLFETGLENEQTQTASDTVPDEESDGYGMTDENQTSENSRILSDESGDVENDESSATETEIRITDG